MSWGYSLAGITWFITVMLAPTLNEMVEEKENYKI